MIGTSPMAGRRAVAQVAASRVATAAPAMVIPALVISYLERRWPAVFRQRAAAIATTGGTCVGAQFRPVLAASH